LTEIFIWLPAIIIALTFHEYAHAKVAYLLGDKTAYYQGRLTLNPLPHIDWVGFLMLIVFKFGWAKPVQVNPYNFKNIGVKQGMMLVSLAGPGMNILLAFAGMVLLRFFIPYGTWEWGNAVITLVKPLIYINLILAAFNLIPIPPLDGSKILAGVLPGRGAEIMYFLERYGFLILLLLIITGTFSSILWPIVNFMYNLLYIIVF